jgi:hypothetical protein
MIRREKAGQYAARSFAVMQPSIRMKSISASVKAIPTSKGPGKDGAGMLLMSSQPAAAPSIALDVA